MNHFKKRSKAPANAEFSDDASEEDIDKEKSENEDTETNSDQDEESQRTAIRQELSSLTFEELEALKSKIGTKEWNEAMFGSKTNQETSGSTSKKKRIEAFKRDNKNRPRELSAKIRVKRVREVVPVKKIEKRDPRFESLCGEYDEKLWSKNYDFIGEIRKTEQEDLKKKLKSEHDDDKRDEIKKTLQKLHDDDKRDEIKKTLQKLANKERSDAVKKAQEEKQRQEREENIQRLKEGKKPYYMKKSTKKFVDLVDKYEQLKSSGQLDSYLKKKRKKNALRDKKGLPAS
ncbi:unnamed protein product [Allacma fusca]|uniref:rRNA biogenesis protein RRP36 n=1 Tax=Allacma fusca TaxID=39272 RepID=A0A8J2LE90_9HEXA|nr:unnamed protein product [Allacma fusca]